MLLFVFYFENELRSHNLTGDLTGFPDSTLAPVTSVIFLLHIPWCLWLALTIHFHLTQLLEEMVKERNWEGSLCIRSRTQEKEAKEKSQHPKAALTLSIFHSLI